MLKFLSDHLPNTQSLTQSRSSSSDNSNPKYVGPRTDWKSVESLTKRISMRAAEERQQNERSRNRRNKFRRRKRLTFESGESGSNFDDMINLDTRSIDIYKARGRNETISRDIQLSHPSALLDWLQPSGTREIGQEEETWHEQGESKETSQTSENSTSFPPTSFPPTMRNSAIEHEESSKENELNEVKFLSDRAQNFVAEADGLKSSKYSGMRLDISTSGSASVELIHLTSRQTSPSISDDMPRERMIKPWKNIPEPMQVAFDCDTNSRSSGEKVAWYEMSRDVSTGESMLIKKKSIYRQRLISNVESPSISNDVLSQPREGTQEIRQWTREIPRKIGTVDTDSIEDEEVTEHLPTRLQFPDSNEKDDRKRPFQSRWLRNRA